MEQVGAWLSASRRLLKRRAIEPGSPIPRKQAHGLAVHVAKDGAQSLQEIARELEIPASAVAKHFRLGESPAKVDASLEEDEEQRQTESLVGSP